MDKSDIAEFLKKELSYDGERDSICPKCGHVLRKGRVWLYHYESMAYNLANHMGFKSQSGFTNPIAMIIKEICQGFAPMGDKKEDSEELAEEIYNRIYNTL